MRDYPTLHLYTNQSKGTAGIKKEYGSKWTLETTQRYTYTQIKNAFVMHTESLSCLLELEQLLQYINLCINIV
jgi:hypothetical protein